MLSFSYYYVHQIFPFNVENIELEKHVKLNKSQFHSDVWEYV